MSLDTSAGRSQFRRSLLQWYQTYHRPLPWRNTRDPYAVWVSEIMLQQTQVATVVDYYLRFLQRFPNVRSLADAPEQDVLALWAGLGYYRRARQMHAAAHQIVEHHAGVFPKTLDAVRTLPGVGRYTAGAIVSFAYDQRAPILEANTLRLYCRLMGLRDDPKRATAQEQLWQFAEQILPQNVEGAGQVNQALMELGSLLCSPQDPNCSDCPVQCFCTAFHQGAQSEIPLRALAKTYTPLHHALVVVQRGNKVLMRQNPTGGWWEGLWDFPRVDLTQLGWHDEYDRAARHPATQLGLLHRALHEGLGLELHDENSSQYLKTIKHGVTRFRIALHCFRARLRTGARLPPTQTWKWIDVRTESSVPLTSTAQKLRRWLCT